MKRVTRNGLIAAAAASGAAMAVTMPAHADASADGGTAASPGLISGNTLQLPVHVPVNVCGNTVNVAGLLNPAAGNGCANVSRGGGPGVGGRSHGRSGEGAGGVARGGAVTRGGAAAVGSGKDSPGVLSGNGLQLPVHLPVNVSGNSVNVVGLGNASVGNTSTNTSGDHPQPVRTAPRPHTTPRAQVPQGTPYQAPPRPMASLAHTGADQTMPAVAASAALLLGGAVLYRRFRPTAVR
ncbi:chaplin [Streptomyces olivochromogenes]|uniref:chaplin n=1 Tax=Streptomyces olivochromogenes TaxID=1963 RepID=UPI0036DDA32D